MRRNVNFPFVARRRIWFAVSAVIVLVSAVSLLVRGLNLSIEFSGGSSFTLSGIVDVEADDLEDAAADAGAESVKAQLVREGDQLSGAIVQTEAIDPGSDTERDIAAALQEVSQAEDVQISFVGPTWGERISQKMLQALLVFLLVVVAYMSVRLEPKMSVAALIALFHDIMLTAGLFSLFQFNVSPATVIALLTILGYSLYDTVIVFDRIQETSGRFGVPGRRTYGESVNTSMNEVLWRSLNTTITSGLPVAALLFIGARALGATTLQDLALALFVGIVTGAYSSLFIAGPFLALWKEREPELAALVEKAERRPADVVERPTPATEEEEEGLAPRGYVRGTGRRSRRRR
ncbi:MAG: protein translocase subunit SecF [Nitriliruptorales bacterium]